MKNTILRNIMLGLGLFILLNLLASFFYLRFDLTEDKRFTLSEATETVIQQFETPVIIDVLLEGELPAEFQRLKVETEQLLENFSNKNSNIKYNFDDPMEDASQAEATLAQLQSIGLTPANVTTENEGKVSQELVFPWAMVTHNDKTVKVALLKNKLGTSSEDRINNSVQNLEYAFADAFTKLGIKEKKRIAVIKGNGELADIYLADILGSLREYYNLGAITLDSVERNPQNVLDQLKTYDLALIAKPTVAFTEDEKYILDQFIVNGGKSLWLVDPVAMELDSLFNEKGEALALARNLNLNTFFFKYGVRINPVLVNDLYFSQIVLATGEGNSADYNPLPWYYNPMVLSKNNHPINTNTEALRFQFTSTIDTLNNEYKKTILAQSSPLSRTETLPKIISFNILNSPPDKEQYTNGNKPLAVLIEGAFSSAFLNRVKPITLEGSKEIGPENKMIVIADGDLIANQLRNNRPLELGYDKWTNNFYGNKEFLLNCANYLLDDSGLINIRNKSVAIPMLDGEKIASQKSRWQFIAIGVPLVFVLLLSLLFSIRRKRRFGQ
ncbi:gliding motility-associated ABC transporter substrate-binding protein GldG [uncultured Muriicola sp.]|uniref:gliding motility-associated ABC transporter substrate-binding protein GldG n=1 Tax=uncultured Muriicola sp. TaxID=1583102 RepID=UPI00261C65CE|nr:gliding motility-associated ABC transporter substrate-binding protein GldG [uncultured Muriicola sp.]